MTPEERAESITKWAIEHFIGVPAADLPADEGRCLHERIVSAIREAVHEEFVMMSDACDAHRKQTFEEGRLAGIEQERKTNVGAVNMVVAAQAAKAEAYEEGLKVGEKSLDKYLSADEFYRKGKSAGLEDAAKIADEWNLGHDHSNDWAAQNIAKQIRAHKDAVLGEGK